MNARFLLIGTIVGAIVLFVWQTFSQLALPWHTATVAMLSSDANAVRAIRDSLPNGVYFAEEGVFVAKSVLPGAPNKAETLMPMMMAKQLVINLVVMLLVCVLVTRLPVQSVVGTGITVAIAGLASAFIIEASNWNWYGFSPGFATVNVIDQTIQFFIAGCVASVLARKFGPQPARTAEHVGVPGGGYHAPATGESARSR